jgi:two-component system, chemotaxis family, chemotaxis protein CheY
MALLNSVFAFQSSRATAAMKLLIVDDSNIIRSRIARVVLRPELASTRIVGLARNGREALDICWLHSPDVVTMDLTMPNMDGIACIERLIDLDPSLNILVVSALNDKATAIEALKKGARGFLHKPFSDQQLIDALLEVAC